MSKPNKDKLSNNQVQPSVSTRKQAINPDLRKGSIEFADLEKLNEEYLKKYQYKSRRNRVLIVTLILLILIAVGVVVGLYSYGRAKDNCFMYTHGRCSAHYIIDGKKLSSFSAPSELVGHRVYELDIKVKIKSSGRYKVRFKANVYQKGELLDNIIILNPNLNLFHSAANNYYESKEPIYGNQTIRLCEGIVLGYEYRDTLNASNFKLEFHTYFEAI